MTDVTRSYLLEQGEGLLFTSDPWQWAARVPLFQEDTGLNAKQLYTTPLFAHPIPIRAPGETSWRALPTNMLWHPLLWLPTPPAPPSSPMAKTERSSTRTLQSGAYASCSKSPTQDCTTPTPVNG